jgi:hypothetical protein
MSGIFPTYTTHILSESFGNMPGIYLDYSSIWNLKPDPLDENPIFVYTLIYSLAVYTEIYY